MTDIASLIIKVDSTDADNASNELDQLTKTAGRTEKATDKLGKSTGKSAKSFKLQKGAAQQVGFQLQDFAVQVSGGTNALVAFGQQGSQLAGIMGPGGALIGAVIAIGSALGGVLFSSIGKASEEMDELNERIQTFIDKTNQVKERTLIGTIGAMETQIRELDSALENVDIEKLEDITGTDAGFFGASRADLIGEAQLRLRDLRGAVALAKKDLSTLTQDNTVTTKKKGDLGVFGPTQEDFDKELQRRFGESERAAIAQQALLDSMRSQLDPAQAEFNRYADQLDAIESFNISAAEKERLREESFRRHGERMAAIAKTNGEEISESQMQSQNMLTDSQASMLGVYSNIFGNMAEIAEKGGKDQFQAYKALASAQAIVAGALAINNALAAAPPPLNFALAATVGALTAVQVGMIANQEYQGARAMGGQVQAGDKYLVGERGPEILTMGTSGGNITPNHALGGQEVKVTNVFQISTGVQATVQSEMLRMAPQIAEMSKRSVEAAINSGGSMARAVGRRG